MKRIWRNLAFGVAAVALLACGALAAGGVESIDGAVTYDETSGKYTASYDEKLLGGNSYALLVVEGTADNYEVTEETILYIDQVDDCDGSSVSFEFIPMNDNGAVVLLGGQFSETDSEVKILGTIGVSSVTVSGTVTSYGLTTNDVTVTLSDGTNTYTATASGGVENAAWSISDVPAGATYTLTVEKKGCVPYTESITLDADVTGKAVTIYLLGDINKSGTHTSTDTAMLKRIIAETYSANDLQKQLADINKSGSFTSTDTTMLKRIIAETYSLQ